VLLAPDRPARSPALASSSGLMARSNQSATAPLPVNAHASSITATAMMTPTMNASVSILDMRHMVRRLYVDCSRSWRALIYAPCINY
jgi:hypothetical protein